MSERRDGQRHYDTSNPCSDPITGVADEDARLREINANLLTACKEVRSELGLLLKLAKLDQGPKRVEMVQARIDQINAAIAKAEETEEDEGE